MHENVSLPRSTEHKPNFSSSDTSEIAIFFSSSGESKNVPVIHVFCEIVETLSLHQVNFHTFETFFNNKKKICLSLLYTERKISQI